MSRRPRRPAGDPHRLWLELVDTDGPFLSVPALRLAWPQGMPVPRAEELAALADAKPAFEKAWENWDRGRDDTAALEFYRGERDEWVRTILTDVLGWNGSYEEGPAIPAIPTVHSPDYAVTVTATGTLVRDDLTGALVLTVDPVNSLRDPLADGWAASPVDRMEELLRASGVPVGVVTDGRWWAIVSARPQTMVASGITDAQTWIEEPLVRNAFIELLRRRRLISGDPDGRLTELFGRSVAAAEDITEALGTQVRRAVELLVQALAESASDQIGLGEPDPLPTDRAAVYEAAVTVMMQVVFLLFAEERGMLPESGIFSLGYGISDELEALDDRAREEGYQALDATHLAWHRLLATAHAMYAGASFEDIRLPAYGGSLFDPARFPFLTSRTERGTLAITISDRVMLEVLRAVQVAQLRGEPARRISFRDIDVEQIGYIYEGLLGYSCTLVSEVTVGLIGKQGEEPEIPLATLEDLATTRRGDSALAEAILAWVKEHQLAATPASKAALAKAIRAAGEVEDAERALRAVTPDAALRHRLRPFIGIIRRDLRNRPLVVLPGGVIVIETPSRASAGAHYTPRSLAEEVVRYALEPLVYSPGPHQEPERNRWMPVSSDQILDLRIADIACGSGAFLVAAARYLAARLVEAWQREHVAVGNPHELLTHAIRTVVATCLYGADINEMAVEMCKLSLWLVSLDPNLPFSFVDDKILHGNSLLGLTDIRQIKRQHINPDSAPAQSTLFEVDVDGILARARRMRAQLSTEVDDRDPQRSATTKRRQWHDYQELIGQLADIADGVIAAGLKLGGKPGNALQAAYQNLAIAIERRYPENGSAPDRTMLDAIQAAGLTPTVTTDYERWKPLHWITAVPDVMERGGFDAIIGNPPFLGGQKLSGALGTNVRDWFVQQLGHGRAGSCDLVGYFILRAMGLITTEGDLGLIATNTVWQGDTREVGLDQVVADGLTIARAIQSRQWPASSANLQYAAIWGTRQTVAADIPRIADGIESRKVTTLLEPAGRVDGSPIRLTENVGRSFKGCTVLGMGFAIPADVAATWIAKDPRNAEVVSPYINGKEFNASCDLHPKRWIVDFYGLNETEAARYDLPYAHVVQNVKSWRLKNTSGTAKSNWWTFERPRPALREAISHAGMIMALTQTSSTQIAMPVPRHWVFDQKLVVFAADSAADLAVLNSSVHRLWATCWGSTRTGDPVYAPSDVFETFPRPEGTGWLTEIGKALNGERREAMSRRKLGLTKLYNLVNDPDTPDSADADVARLRAMHVDLDEAVMAAYGWSDIPLDHGFHTYRQMQRWTVSPAARVEILDRLLEENHHRAAEQGEAPPPAEAEDEGEDE